MSSKSINGVYELCAPFSVTFTSDAATKKYEANRNDPFMYYHINLFTKILRPRTHAFYIILLQKVDFLCICLHRGFVF